MSDQEQATTARPTLLRRLASDGYVGALVAALSILTALVGYEGYLAQDRSNNLQIAAIKSLTESNTEFLRANQDIIVDYNQFDNYVIYEGNDDEIADYFYGNFSPELLDSIEREDGPFDLDYYDEVFADADETYEEALDQFDEAEAWGDEAESYQLIMMISAVGLALAAWSSLVAAGSAIRLIFMGLGATALVVSLLAYMGTFAG